jgi:hypothetical protein
MSDKQVKASLLTPMFRMSYAHLLEPRQFIGKNGKPQGDPSFSMNAILNADDLKKFRMIDENDQLKDVDITQVCKDLAAEKWPGQALGELFPKKPNGTSDWPIKKGDTIIALEAKKSKPKDVSFLAGMFQIPMKGNTTYPPQLRYRENGETVVLDRENEAHKKVIKKLFDSGNYATAEISVMAQETPQGNFITFYLNKVMFKKEGKRLGGQSLMDRFDGIDGGSDDFDPTAGDDFGGNDI